MHVKKKMLVHLFYEFVGSISEDELINNNKLVNKIEEIFEVINKRGAC